MHVFSRKKRNRALHVAALFGAGLAASATFESSASASTASFTGSYTPNFSLLPFTNGTSINSANPNTIGGTSYSLQSGGAAGAASAVFDFNNPIDTTGDGYSSVNGGLALSGLSGWYGGETGASSKGGNQLGANPGDQTTGGIISYGGLSSSTRSLGVISTSTSGNVSTGVELINNTGSTVGSVNVNFVYEIWHAGNKNSQTVSAYYTVDNALADTLLTAQTAGTALPGSSSITVGTGGGGVALDGTQTTNQQGYKGTLTNLNWTNGGALWLVFADTGGDGGSAAGIAIQTDSVAGVDSNPFVATPEPASLGLLSISALGILVRRRRKG